AFSRATSPALRLRGIAVHTVNPGFVETEGFPQRTSLRNPLLQRTVIDPEEVAAHVLKVICRGPSETTIPRWYRGVAVAQTLAPGLLARAYSLGVAERVRRDAVL